MDFFSGLWDWFKGSSITSSLAKTALLGYASRLLSNSTSPTSSGTNTIVDPGVRLQLNPNTENKIPVLYGEAYFGGYITDAQLSADYKKMTYCLTLAELTGIKLSTSGASGYTFEGVYINSNRVVFKADGVTVDYTLDSSGNQDISARDSIKIYFYCDQTGVQPVGYSGTTPSPYSTMPGWSSGTHSMEDLCYAIVEVTYNKDAGVTGLPDLTFNLKSTNTLVGDVLYDYMTNYRYGAGINVAEIDTSSLVALNTYCTTGFTYTDLSNQSTSSQITVNGLVDTNTDALTNMQALAEAGSSWITYDIHSGLWKVVINKSGSSVASFTDSNIVGEISVSGTSLTQLNNVADVKYQNTDIQDKTDFVKISIPSGSLFPNEPLNSIQINLPFTNKQVVAAKIGLQQLKQARIDKIIKFKTDYSYILLSAGDIIDVTSSVYGFTNKLFRIITVTQSEGDLGDINLDFTALEYDSSVYTYDIAEYEVISDNGILGIGSIGKPNTPTVTKTEEANVPKIVINAQVPSGVVDTMEYWITFDTGVSNDSARNYILIGRYTNNAGTALTEDDVVSYTYTGLQQSNFYVKVRGANNVTTGPFSDPSGLIAYVPTVVADTVSDTPVSIGGQLMGLGLLTLLNNLDKLFGGDISPGSLLDTVVKGIKEATGVDLASGATVSADIGIKDEGDTVTTQTSSINFVGDGVTATSVGNDVTVTIGSTSGGGSGADGPGNSGEANACTFAVSPFYPPDMGTAKPGDQEKNEQSDRANITGAYSFTASGYSKSLRTGKGNVYLYKSDGTLAQTKAAGTLTISDNVVSIPFADRDYGVDYYILIDKGVLTDGLCQNLPITDPYTWSFHTATPDDDLTVLAPTPPVVPKGCQGLGFVEVKAYKTSVYVSKQNTNQGQVLDKTLKLVDNESSIGLKFNQNIILGKTGTITIYGGGVFQVFDISKTFNANKIAQDNLFWVSGDTLWLNPTKDFVNGTRYYINMTSNCVYNACNTSGNQAITSPTTATWLVDPGPVAGPAEAGKGGIKIGLDRPAKINPAGTINIVDSNGTVVKSLPGTSPSISSKEA